MKRFAIYREIAIATSIPLALLLYLYILTGYCMIKSHIVEIATFGLLSYSVCIELHTSRILRLLMISLALLHGFSALLTLVVKIRSTKIRKLIEILLITLAISIATQFLLIEFT